jgi:hypothetical protein
MDKRCIKLDIEVMRFSVTHVPMRCDELRDGLAFYLKTVPHYQSLLRLHPSFSITMTKFKENLSVRCQRCDLLKLFDRG